MDLYQIFVTHNRPWSVREMVAFSVVLFVTAIVAGGLYYCRKIRLSQAVAGILLVVFLGIVFGSTVFTRASTGYHNYELELFWSWKEVLWGSKEMLKENLLNIFLLFPVGLLLPWVFGKKVSWAKALFWGVLISAAIETSQLIFCRGLFEWDDMIHNGIGCMTGCLCMNWFRRMTTR